MPATEPSPPAVPDAVRRNMQANRGRDTSPELAVRSRLHAMGMRYRVATPLPFDRRRRADIFFSRVGLYVFIDGCYWHGCPEHFVQPKTNAEFWRTKIHGNTERDADTTARLQALGYEVLRFWEHDDPTVVAAEIRDRYLLARRNRAPHPVTLPSQGGPLAIIRSFDAGRQSVRIHGTEVDCYYQTVTADDGSIYLHLTTFGSDDRAVPGKSSQSFQLSASSARELLKIIEATFGRSRD